MKRKAGRKAKPHVMVDGTPVAGLYRLPDGRWRVTKPGPLFGHRFTESDERLAVAKFYRMTMASRVATISAPLAAVMPELNLSKTASITTEGLVNDARQVVRATNGLPGRIHVNFGQAPADWEMTLQASEAQIWAWVRQQMIERPKYVAQQTGIEQIGWMSGLKAPTQSPTLEQVGKYYFGEKSVSKNWMDKTKAHWSEFCSVVKVNSLRELTQENVIDYRAHVRDLASKFDRRPTFSRQRYQCVKAVLNFPPKEGRWAEDCNRAAALCAVLVPPPSSKPNPCPIDPVHFAAILAVCDAQQRAIFLLMLNGCMYPGEVVDLLWQDFDLRKGVMVNERNKTGVVRVCTLWNETIQALSSLPRRGDVVFHSKTGGQHTYDSFESEWRDLREIAHIPSSVQLSHIRDGSYTAAVDADDVKFEHAEILAGHQTGMADRYVKRRPKMVAGACAAIYRAYDIEKISSLNRTIETAA